MVQAMNGPFVDILLLEESDIPPEVLTIDFDSDFDGHWEEIYAINTRSRDCLSATTAVDFMESHWRPHFDRFGAKAALITIRFLFCMVVSLDRIVSLPLPNKHDFVW